MRLRLRGAEPGRYACRPGERRGAKEPWVRLYRMAKLGCEAC